MQVPPKALQSVDYEHGIQINLVEALVKTLQRGEDLGGADEILDQLVAFSEAHFMAEQLLMRLHAYPQYQEHAEQHDDLIGRCARLRQTLRGGNSDVLSEARQFKAVFLRHLEGPDHQLGAFLGEASANPSRPC